MRGDPDFGGNGGGPAGPTDGQLDVAAILRALRRRKRWIVLPTLLALVASAVYVAIATPRYRSEAHILIESRETGYSRPEVDRGDERERPPLDAEAVQSQVQIALSRDLARQVVRELKLAERREFNPQPGDSLLGRSLALLGLIMAPARTDVEERVLDRFYDRMSVYQLDRSRVIAVQFRSQDAQLAAQVANAVAEGQIELQQQAKQDAMRQASQWLAREIERMRERVAEAEARVEQFRGKSNLFIGANNNTLSAQQLGELNSQIVLARTQRADAESKAKLIREMLRSGKPIEASEIVNSEIVRRLNEQRVLLQAQLAEQSSTLLSQHPRIKELKAQIADLEAQTRTEAARLVSGLESDAQISASRVETLMAAHDQMKDQASRLGGEDVQLRALEREAKAQRDLLESYLSRYRDVTARESPDAVPPDARIVSRAVPASTPYFPNRIAIVLLATLGTMLCAVGLVGLGPLLSGEATGAAPRRSTHEIPETVESKTPASWVGPVRSGAAPPLRGEARGLARARELAGLVAHVRGLGRGVVVVSGAEGREPSGNVAIELARELAQDGGRVLLLDLDVERAPAAALAADPRAPGLSDLLFGVANFGEVIQRDRASRIHVITTGRGVRDTVSLLSAEKLGVVFGAVAQTYDQVIVAAPTLTALPGAERLARFSRAVILVSAQGREGAGAAISDQLAGLGFANVAVVALMPDALPPGGAHDRVAA
jgi:uncharacterized protein involved in exopolysaccharide biosynthesis